MEKAKKAENALQTWTNDELGTIHTVTIENEPVFLAKDVAAILGYKKTNDMTKRLDDDEKGATNCRTLGGNQKLAVITESGLYHAIFMSRLDAAKKLSPLGYGRGASPDTPDWFLQKRRNERADRKNTERL